MLIGLSLIFIEQYGHKMEYYAIPQVTYECMGDKFGFVSA